MTVPGADGCDRPVDDGDKTLLTHIGTEMEVAFAQDDTLPDPTNTSAPVTQRAKMCLAVGFAVRQGFYTWPPPSGRGRQSIARVSLRKQPQVF